MVRFWTGPSERYKDWTKYSQRPITRTEIARNISFPHFSLNQSKSNSKIQPLKKRKVSFSHYGSFSPLSHTKFPGSQGALNLREAPLDMRHWGMQNIPRVPRVPALWDIAAHLLLLHSWDSENLTNWKTPPSKSSRPSSPISTHAPPLGGCHWGSMFTTTDETHQRPISSQS